MKKSQPDRPFTIDLELPLLQRLAVAQRKLKKRSVSELIREALAEFDVEAYEPTHPPHLQVSVRLPAAQRKALKKAGRVRRVSVGELVRVAVEGYFARNLLPEPAVPPTIKTPDRAQGKAPAKAPPAGAEPGLVHLGGRRCPSRRLSPMGTSATTSQSVRLEDTVCSCSSVPTERRNDAAG